MDEEWSSDDFLPPEINENEDWQMVDKSRRESDDYEEFIDDWEKVRKSSDSSTSSSEVDYNSDSSDSTFRSRNNFSKPSAKNEEHTADNAYENIDITYARAIDPDIRFTLRPSAPSRFVGSCL